MCHWTRSKYYPCKHRPFSRQECFQICDILWNFDSKTICLRTRSIKQRTWSTFTTLQFELRIADHPHAYAANELDIQNWNWYIESGGRINVIMQINFLISEYPARYSKQYFASRPICPHNLTTVHITTGHQDLHPVRFEVLGQWSRKFI